MFSKSQMLDRRIAGLHAEMENLGLGEHNTYTADRAHQLRMELSEAWAEREKASKEVDTGSPIVTFLVWFFVAIGFLLMVIAPWLAIGGLGMWMWRWS